MLTKLLPNNSEKEDRATHCSLVGSGMAQNFLITRLLVFIILFLIICIVCVLYYQQQQ